MSTAKNQHYKVNSAPESTPVRLLRAIVMAVFAGARIAVSMTEGVWFAANQLMDDVLMVEYAFPKTHFLNPNVNSLVKSMGYPLFLDVVSVSRVRYSIWMGVLWVLAALFVYKLMKNVQNSRIPALLAYVYVLFLPVGLEDSCGFRLYRNGIVDPFVIMLFSLTLMFMHEALFDRPSLTRQLLACQIVAGLLLTFTCYIKEDGIWILACEAAAALITIVIAVIRYTGEKRGERAFSLAVLCLIPFLIFGGGTAAYRKVNEHYFGVSAIETRTSGEIGGFISRLYRINAASRTSVYWIPASAIERAFEVSETLAEHPELEEFILKETVYGDITKKGVRGDDLGWGLRHALTGTGLWTTEKEVSDFFAEVNRELDEAFRDGSLKKSTRISLLPSAGSYSWPEIWDLKREITAGYMGAVVQKGYYPGIRDRRYAEAVSYADATEAAKKLTHEKYLGSYEERALTEDQQDLQPILSDVFYAYGVLNVLLLILSLFAAIACIIRFFAGRNRKNTRELFFGLSAFCFLGISLVYMFGISWFSHFIWGDGEIDRTILNYYACALPAILMFAYGSGVCWLTERIRKGGKK